MRYIVTGGAGFIGSHIVEELVSRGEDVIVIDNLCEGKLSNIKTFSGSIKFLKKDILDYSALLKAFRNVDSVLHQAALRSVPLSVKEPKRYNEVNIQGTLNVLEASRRCDVKRVVFASSSSVYGNTNELPEKENSLPKPLSPYALTKLAGEYYSRMFSELYGMETINLRYFNIFGPRQYPDSQYSGVISLFVRAVSTSQQPMIYGDGLQSRDFTFVKNVVDANLLACQRKKKLSGETVNIAQGSSVTINELLKLVNKFLGREIQPVYSEPRPGDVRHTLADLGLARKILGYKPRYTFEHGLKETVEWYKSTQM